MQKYYEAYDKRYRQVHAQALSWASDCSSPIVSDCLRRFITVPSPRILEVGCGEGRDCLPLLAQGYDVQALDVSEEAIRYCRDLARPEDRDRFHVVDVCTQGFDGTFDFIYSVATLHMLVLPEDRRRYLAFIRSHLAQGGAALILTMGDGAMASESRVEEAFLDKPRIHQQTGTELMIAATSCKMVSFPTFREELQRSGFSIEEDGLTCIEPDFPVIMYAVVRAGR